MLTFRKAAPDDLPSMLTLVRQAQAFMASQGIDQWQDGYPSKDILAEDIRLGRIYVYDDDGAIASISVLTDEPEPIYDQIGDKWLSTAPYLTIHRMALDDAHRHSGLAAKILENAVEMAKKSDKPFAIICKTVKGKGVSFMENKAEWHGSAPNAEQYEQAMKELEAVNTCCAK